MDIKSLASYLQRSCWDNKDFRPVKNSLVTAVQQALIEFAPLNAKEYENNPIQVLDFFSGAGGTSLGFAALNNILPAYKTLQTRNFQHS